MIVTILVLSILNFVSMCFFDFCLFLSVREDKKDRAAKKAALDNTLQKN